MKKYKVAIFTMWFFSKVIFNHTCKVKEDVSCENTSQIE